MPDETPWYVQNCPEIGQRFQDFYQACKTAGTLDNKTKELLMAALACVFRCPHCTESHVKGALEAGATKAEISEALLIAAVEGAGTQLAWAHEIFVKHLGSES